MAVQTTEEFKNGGATSYAITIEYLQASDIKVRIGGVLQTYVASSPSSGEYTVSGTTVTLGAQAAAGSGNVHIYRETDVNTAAAVFAAGSSIRAADLNAIHDMGRFAAVEHRNQVITANIKDGQVTTAKIAADNITSALIADDQIDSEHYVADSIDSEHYAPGSVDSAAIGASQVTTNELATDSVNTTKIIDLNVTTAKIAADAINASKLADDSVYSEHIAAGQVSTSELAADCINASKIQDDAVFSEHIAANAVSTSEILNDAVTIDKIADAAIVTAAEQATAASNDTSFLTVAAADARFFNVSTGDTIKDGQTFPDNDTSIATTAAINDRIIDLVEEVGGFVPIASETNFPTANPDVNNGTGTLVSIKSIGTSRTPSGGTVTIANGAGTGNTVIITGCGSTVLPAGFGVIVETTSTLHTYTFHRLTPKATEVTTVAGISSNITTTANNDANITTVATNIANVNTTATNIANVNTTATNIGNVNTTAGSIANVNTVATNIANVNTTAGSIANVNTTATNIASVNNASANINSINNFGDTYQVHTNNPTTDGGGNTLAAGDLYFNTSANELKVYNGSSWQSGVTATGSFAQVTGNTFTGDNRYNDGVKALFGTGSDLEIFHNGTYSILKEPTKICVGSAEVQITDDAIQTVGAKFVENAQVELNHNGSKKLETNTSGIGVTGNITVSGNVDGRDLAADGTKLDGIASGAIANVVEDTTPQLGGNLDGNGFEIALDGDKAITFDGKGNIEYKSSQFQITNSTGDILIDNNASGGDTKIYTNTDFEVYVDDGDAAIKAIKNGAVELYHSGTKKFETSNTGATVTGNLTSTKLLSSQSAGSAGLGFGDNVQIHLGDSDDLQLFHTGSGSVIQNGASSGQLTISSDDALNLCSRTGTEYFFRAYTNGAAELYHDNALRLKTEAWGVRTKASGQDTMLVVEGEASRSAELRIYADNGNQYADYNRIRKEASTGKFHIQNYTSGSWEDNIVCINEGAVELLSLIHI